MRLSARFAKAFAFAHRAHGPQLRKGTSIPYLSHPMAVSALVLEYGGSEDQAIAALLHDTIEDCGVTEAELARLFGAPVARMVRDCTDAETFPKPPWKERKERYLERLAREAGRSLLVSAADKLHNARAIVKDVRGHGAKIWKRFSAPRREIAWYYRSLHEVFERRKRDGGPGFKDLVGELGEAVRALTALASPGPARR